jgi:two-component system sensor histidine kinase SenX3
MGLGLGLGLAIVKRVAVNHGGDIQLQSKPHIGSTFTLRIPSHKCRATHPGRTINTGPRSPQANQSSHLAVAGCASPPQSAGHMIIVPDRTLE